MTGIENIDPADSEPGAAQPGAAPVLSMEPEDSTARADFSSLPRDQLVDRISRAQTRDEIFAAIDEVGPTIGMMAVPIPGFRGLGVARAATKLGLGRGVKSLSAGVASRTPSQVGKAVSTARNTLRRVNPKRPGSHSQAASPPPLKPMDTRLGTGGPLQRFSERTALHAQQGARDLSAAGRHRRVLTGPRGALSRLGVSPETRGVLRAGTRTLPIAGTLGVAVGEGLASLTADNLKRSELGGEGSSPASDAAKARAIDDALSEAMRGNIQEAEDMLVDAGLGQQQVGQALDAAQQARREQGPNPTTQPEEPPGRTLQQQQDSLARQANQPGLPPTAQQALQGQQDASAALALAEEQAQLANEGRLPPVYVSEGIEFDHPSAPARSNLRRVNQVLGDIFDMGRDELVDMQHKLFAAGFYGARNYDSIRFGAKDPATMTAFQGFLEQAASKTNRALAEVDEGFGSTQEGVVAPTGISSWRDTLEKWATDAGGVEGVMGKEDPVFAVTLTDPEGIKAQLQQLSQSVIGRGMSPRAEQRFVSMFHNQQRDAQLEQQRARREAEQQQLEARRNRSMALREMQRETGAQPGAQAGAQAQQPQSQPSPEEQVVETTQPSVTGQGQAFLESEFPTESEAFSTVQQYDDFLSIIGATRG